MLPAKLKNYNVHADGDSWLGLVSEVTLPKVTRKTEAYRGGGMLGEVDVELGLEKLEMELKLGGLVVGAMRAFGAIGVAGTMLRFNGAYQEDGAGLVTPAELVVRGLHVELDPGSAKAGDDTEWTLKSTLTYLKWRIAGRTVLQIDMIAGVFEVDGVDRQLAIRAALGVI